MLSWLSLGWMTIEGAVAITAGIIASSVALVGFGLDSVIEGVASRDHHLAVHRRSGLLSLAEQRAQKLVALQFFLLAPYVGVESIRRWSPPSTRPSWLGIGLAVGSVILMPMLGIAKQRLADQLGSAATKGEGRQNMLCAYSPGPFSSAFSATPFSAPGGSTGRRASRSRPSPSRRAVRHGTARAAVSAHR